MRDSEQELAVRMDAAKAAAPYLHARLSSVELTPTTLNYAERLKRARERIERRRAAERGAPTDAS